MGVIRVCKSGGVARCTGEAEDASQPKMGAIWGGMGGRNHGGSLVEIRVAPRRVQGKPAGERVGAPPVQGKIAVGGV